MTQRTPAARMFRPEFCRGKVNDYEDSPKEHMFLPAQQPFELELGWLRPQAFRWLEREGWYYGLVNGHLIKIRQAGDGVEFRSSVAEESIQPHVESYFRLYLDIRPVHEALRQIDHTMAGLVDRYGAMRLLRQDPWECLISYICSQNNSIDRISGIVDLLAKCYGDPLVLDGVRLNTFPSPRRLAEVGSAELDGLKLGLRRGNRIYQVARAITEGDLDLAALFHLPYEQARNRLMNYDGIGPKIADCVCLFSLDKPEAFPVDRHIAAALREHYGKKYTPGAKNTRLLEWARRYFGAHAGYAGQLLFYEQLN